MSLLSKTWRQRISLLILLLLFFVSSCQSIPFTRKIPRPFAKPVAYVYTGRLADEVDYIAKIPPLGEAERIAKKLKRIPKQMEAMLRGKKPLDLKKIEEMKSYFEEKSRELEILQWSLLELYETQKVSLLPGEGVTLQFNSYCLDASLAAPHYDEFYRLDKIPYSQSLWLPPVLNYAALHQEKDLPVQGLIWNLAAQVPYQDLPDDQKVLLKKALPDVVMRFKIFMRFKISQRFIEPTKQKVKERLAPVTSVIENINEISEQIENRKSRFKLVRPKYDIYQLENGMLVRAKSTGGYRSLILTIVNPKSNRERSEKPSTSTIWFASTNPRLIKLKVASLSGSSAQAQPGSEEWEEWEGRWERAEKTYELAKEAHEALKAYEEGVDGVSRYVKGRGFKESIGVFKWLNKDNPEATKAIEIFENFNLDLINGEKEKKERPKNPELKPFEPSRYRFKPGRRDVQPLGARG